MGNWQLLLPRSSTQWISRAQKTSRNQVLKMMIFVFKMMNFVFKMMNFVLKMMKTNQRSPGCRSVAFI